MQPPTELALDDATLAELYQRYAHTLLAFIRRYASTREDAEDVLLDVFLAASEQHALANMSEGEQLALRAEEHALLRDHLARLPEVQQEILRLRFANGLRCVEIAQMYNKREGTVRMLLSRALNLLRGLYEQQAEEGERA